MPGENQFNFDVPNVRDPFGKGARFRDQHHKSTITQDSEEDPRTADSLPPPFQRRTTQTR